MESNNQLPTAADNPNPEDFEEFPPFDVEELLVLETSKLSLEEAASEGRDRPNNQVVTYHKSVEHGKYVPVLLSLGFRFQPDDYEIMEFLNKKISQEAAPCIFIPSVNVYDHSPEELSGMQQSLGVDEWYFFSPRERKYANGKRPSRAAGGKGYWKATGRNTDLLHDGFRIGSKMCLTFHEGKPPAGRKTEWNMTEFVSNQPERERTGPDDMRLDDCVLCRIHKNSSETEEAGEQKQRKRKTAKTAKTEHDGNGVDRALASDQVIWQDQPSDLGTGAHSFVSNQHQSVPDGQPSLPLPPPQEQPRPQVHPPWQQQSLQNLPPAHFTLKQPGLRAPQQHIRLPAQRQPPRLRARAQLQHRPEQQQQQQQQSLQNPQQYDRPGHQPNLQNPEQYLQGHRQIQMVQHQPTLPVLQQYDPGQQPNPWLQENLQNPQQSFPRRQPIPRMPHQHPRQRVPQQRCDWQPPNLQNPHQYLPEAFLDMLQHQHLPWQHSNLPTSDLVGQHHLDSVQYSHQAGSQDLGGMLDCPPERIPEDLIRNCLRHSDNSDDQDILDAISRLLPE